jgi:tetratricopeptide (TPR) repeat protein
VPYRKRQSRKAPLPRAEDVLSGRVRVDAGTLIDLIARVNPTGLPLPKRESAARYARKTALQNMLIRQHADDLEAEAEPGREGIVRLRHRRLGRFACHVAIDDLDDEARSWVRMQLDLREAQAWEEAQEKSQEKKDGARREAMAGRARAVRPEAADTGGSGSAVDLPGEGEQAPAALLKQGLDALEEYDYERARACLEKAFEKSGGEGEPAAALIGFLVETMGSYDEAFAAVARAEEALAGAGGGRPGGRPPPRAPPSNYWVPSIPAGCPPVFATGSIRFSNASVPRKLRDCSPITFPPAWSGETCWRRAMRRGRWPAARTNL